MPLSGLAGGPEPVPASDLDTGSQIDRVESLLAQHRRCGEAKLRAEAIELAMPIASRLARRYYGRGEDSADLEQVAMVGLVNAVDRYDPARPAGFLPFAVATVLGELKRHFRDRTWALRVPRSIKERTLLIRTAVEHLERQGSPVNVTAIAEQAGLQRDEVLEGLEAYEARQTVSLDAPTPTPAGREGAPLGELLGAPDESIDLAVEAAALGPALERLPQTDRLLIELRFVRGLTQSQIGERIGVSQMQVSRLLRSLCDRLRNEVLDE